MHRFLARYTLTVCLVSCAALCLGAQAQAAALEIVNATPRGTVRDLTQITLRFNQDMRPLGVMDEEAHSSPLQLSVAHGTLPAGNFRWLDPATLAYIFDAPVLRPLTITARVPRGTASLSGAALKREYAWRIHTPPLNLSLGNDKHPLPREHAKLSLDANYPLDVDALREKARLTVNGAPLDATLSEPQASAFPQGRSGFWRYTFTIKDTLPKNSTVTLAVDAGLTAREGGSPAESFALSMPTFGDLRLVSWESDKHGPDGKHAPLRPEAPLRLFFNNPIKYRDLLDALAVMPPIPKSERWGGFHPDSTDSSFSLPFVWQPRTRYTVAIAPALRDTFGTQLAGEERITFTTGDFAPSISGVPYRDYAFMESALGGRLPLQMRNMGTITATLRHLPWGREALHVLSSDGKLSGKAFRTLAGGREKTIAVDAAGRPNRFVCEMLDIPGKLGLSGPAERKGLFAVSLQSPKSADTNPLRDKKRGAILQVTDLGLAVRLGDRQGIAWAASLASGKVLPGASVRLLDKDGRSLWSGVTDEAGIAYLPGLSSLEASPRFCMAETQDDASVLLLPQNTREEYDTRKKIRSWGAHAVSQLPLYQAGQDVNAVVFLREYADSLDGKPLDFHAWLPAAGEPLIATVLDRRDRAVYSAKVTSNAYGSFPLSFTLPPDAEPGWYRVLVKSAQDAWGALASPFRVASFRPPEFKVDVAAPDPQPVPPASADPLRVRVQAGYFSGALLPGGSVEIKAEYTDTRFTPQILAGYATGPDLDAWSSRDPRTESARGTLDATGGAVLELPGPAHDALSPQRLFLTATVTDAAKLASQGTASSLLHPSASYIGMRCPYFAPRGRDVTIELKAATWDNQPLAGAAVSLHAERVTYKDGELSLESVWRKELVLAEEAGDRLAVRFERPGVYMLSASIRDAQNRENVAVCRVHVPGSDPAWSGFARGRYLELLTEKRVYSAGDTARLAIANPPESATALVTVERDGVRRAFVREVSGDNPFLDIPLETADAPYVYVHVALVTGRAAPPPAPDAPGPDRGAPLLQEGSVLLKLSGAEADLEVAVSTDAPAYTPGGLVRASARVTDAAGTAKKAQVTLLAVDERVLRAGGGRHSYNPTFRQIYRNVVHANDVWRFLVDNGLIADDSFLYFGEGVLGKWAPSPAPYAIRQEAAKVRGRGDDTNDDVAVRRNFTPLAFWLAEGETDSEGRISVEFTLPDALTAWRVVAVAADRGRGFGTGQASITASKPLQVLPALPSFVTEGDAFDAGVLVQNTGDSAAEAVVTLTAAGGRLGVTSRSVSLAPGKSALLSFPLSVDQLAGPAGKVTLLATGRTEKAADAAEFVLPVKAFRPLTTVAAAGLLAEGEEDVLPVKAPANLDPRSRLEVLFAPSPVAGVSLGARQIIDYPWNCLEQRLSRAWARSIRLEHGPLLGLPEDARDRDALAEEMRIVASLQGEDGSFSLWPGLRGGPLDLYLTAYALLVSREVEAQGQALPGERVQKACAFLEKSLRSQQAEGAKNAAAPEAQSFALYALALHAPHKAAPLYRDVLALCEKKTTNPFGWASLLLARPLLPDVAGGERAVARILAVLEKSAAVTATHLHFGSAYDSGSWRTLGSDLRDNAMLLAALSLARRDYPRLEALAAWVGQRTGDTKILNTQEAAFGLWAMAAYLKDHGGTGETALHAVWNGKDTASASFAKLASPPKAWVLPAGSLNGGSASQLVLTAGKGRPYWTARLAYASPDLPMKAENAGFAITRKLKSLGPWKVGDTLEVELTITVPATRRHVLVFDPFPAGFEPLYASRVDLRDRERDGKNRFWQWRDALDDGMLLYAPVLHPGVYTYTHTLRAVAAGTFHQRPSFVEEMYAPESFGRTEAGVVVIVPE